MKISKSIVFIVIWLFNVHIALAYNVGLKISSSDKWTNWGDYILGKDLADGFQKLGHTVIPSYSEDFYPSSQNNVDIDIDIYMHGFIPFNPPQNNKYNVLYLYYPLETANMRKYKNIKNISEPDWYSLETELWDYKLIATASPSYAKEIEKFGIKTIFTPQFTNPEKFFYEYDEEKSFDILFVGRPGYERISAKWAIESGFDVALFGDGWQDIAPQHMFKGAFIDNNELNKYYASAKIVLNDTRNDMKEKGFISNRVFDVTASGGFLISDYMPEIEQFYGDNIPMFKTKEELRYLIDYYLQHPEERKIKAKKAQEITLENFTNIAVAKKIINAYEQKYPALDENKIIIQTALSKEQNMVGDYHLALDLEHGFEENGTPIKHYYFNNDYGYIHDDFYKEAKNLLYLQFKFNHYEMPQDDGKIRMLYFYFPTFIPNRGKFKNTEDTFKYNTDAFLNNELEYFDIIATPAKKTLDDLRRLGYNAHFVPQFTNPQKFKYDYDDRITSELLFVGSTWYDRVSARYATELNYDVSIYGLNWEGKVNPQYIKGRYIDNDILNKYYSSAKIVLSDHAEDLSEMGLVINRLYDASATGAFVISEYSSYIEEIFGDAIPMFKTKDEFKKLVDYYLKNPSKRMEKAKKAQEIVLRNYTNRHIAEQINNLFHQYEGQ